MASRYEFQIIEDRSPCGVITPDNPHIVSKTYGPAASFDRDVKESCDNFGIDYPAALTGGVDGSEYRLNIITEGTE